MGRATSKGNEAKKSKMKQPSDMPTPRFEHRKYMNASVIIINNCKTIAPISSDRIELSGAASTGVVKTHSPGTMQSSSTNGRMEWKLRKDND